MDIKATLLDLLEHAYKEEQAFVAQLSDKERSAAGTAEQWSVKDMIAHNVTWTERLVRNLAPEARNEPPIDYGDINQTNAEIFETHCHKSWAEVLEHLEKVHRLLVERTQALADELAATDAFSWQSDRPLWRHIVGVGYSHPLSHIAQYYAEHGKANYATEMQETVAHSLTQFDGGPAWEGVVRYNLACHYSVTGEKEKAIRELGEALRLNPDLIEFSKDDPDLTPIREEPDYQSLYVE